MKRLIQALALILLVGIPIAAKADNGVVTITVTNVAANITVDRDCNFVVIRENSATPTAVFDITIAGSATAHHYAAGTQYIFAAPKGAGGAPIGGWAFHSGNVIGTIVATTAGPFTFTADESFGEPSLAAKNGTGAGAAATDATLSVSDVTANNVSISAHGFAPKAPNDATKYLDGTAAYSVPPVTTDATLTSTDVTTNNASTSKHGFMKKLPNTPTTYYDGTGAFSVPPVTTDATLTATDITTNDVSTSKHGFAPKAPNDVTKFLNGTGAYSTPSGGDGESFYASVGLFVGRLREQYCRRSRRLCDLE